MWWIKKLKIAGITHDNEEGKEIEAIVKVALIAKRMKNLPYEKKEQNKVKKETETIIININEYTEIKSGNNSLFTARGLN